MYRKHQTDNHICYIKNNGEKYYNTNSIVCIIACKVEKNPKNGNIEIDKGTNI